MKKLTSVFVACLITTIYAFATPPCIASFTTDINPDNGDTICVGLPIVFTNTSDLGGESLVFKQWNFGDGSPVVNQENTTHTFTQSGTFIVTFNLASNSCTGLNVQKTIYVIDQPMGMAFGTVDATCFGFCNGEAQLDIQIAPHGNYNILWDDANAQTTTTATNLCAGTYSVNASDVYGCSADFNATVNEPAEIVVFAGADIYICEGSQWPISDADIVSGGVGSLEYIWEPGFALSDATALNPILTVDEPGDFGLYILTAIDDNGCSGVDGLEVIETPGSISGTITEPNTGGVMDGVLVSLIKRGNDDTQWEIYDTYTTALDGMFHFMNLPLTDYIVKAELPGSEIYMPTFYHVTDAVFYWEEAQITTVTCGTMISNTDITLMTAPGSMGGDCAFEGMVYLVSCSTPPCKTQTEDPIPLIDVIVKKTPPGNAVALTQTSDGSVLFPGLVEGKFRVEGMPALPNDTFSFVINVPGLAMQDNYEIVVEADDIIYGNLNFYVDTTPGTGGIFIYNPLGVAVIKQTRNEMKAYPNPFSDNCELRFTNTAGSNFAFTLFDVTGKLIFSENEQEGNTYLIKTDKLEQGIYIAEVRTEEEVFRTRVMKK